MPKALAGALNLELLVAAPFECSDDQTSYFLQSQLYLYVQYTPHCDTRAILSPVLVGGS